MSHVWRRIHVKQLLCRWSCERFTYFSTFLPYRSTNFCQMCKDKLIFKNLLFGLSLSLLGLWGSDQSVVSVLVGLKAGAGPIGIRLFRTDFWTLTMIIRVHPSDPVSDRLGIAMPSRLVHTRFLRKMGTNILHLKSYEKILSYSSLSLIICH